MAGRFPRGSAFPAERFVQEAVERWLVEQGYQLSTGQHNPDLRADRGDGSHWWIEAKGQTQAVGLDFRTGLGQLVMGMDDGSRMYALAMPDTPPFQRQCQRVPERVRLALGIWRLMVDERGDVRAVRPGESVDDG